jgi:putative tryptophan/tyrosine transport system substrate-binding protein
MQFGQLSRREFITLVGGAAAAWPLAARAQQQPAMPVVGFLHSGSASDDYYVKLVTALRTSLNEAGYTPGRNVTIEFRWAEGQYDRIPMMTADLARRRVAVIFAGGDAAAIAAKAATSTIPIVFTIGDDPVKIGLVDSLSRPGGNVTGVTLFYVEIEAKRLEFLRELVPNAEVIALLVNPKNKEAENQIKEARVAADAIGRSLVVLEAGTESEVETAFASGVRKRAGALMVASDFFLTTRRNQLVGLADQHALPTIYPWREATLAGGLMSYGAVIAESYRQAGAYIGRILKGAKPAELPVLQPTKFQLLLNLKTARKLGIDVPTSLLIRADEIIE